MTRPNLLYVFGDQWRAQALGYAGDPNARTPRIDRFAAESADFVNATSGTPVCCPFRATLMTGQEPLTHGVMVNDVSIVSDAVPLAECFNRAGYRTGYIGKWHIDGHGRQAYVPPERRLGFQYWRGFECTHDYNRSFYYADTPERLTWDGYDAEAQTDCAIQYLRNREREQPFALFLSWGPPHAPYHTAPERCRAKYSPEDIVLRPNVPDEFADSARKELAGYYAHIEALDECFGRLLDELDALGLAEDTVVVFASDHGDMIGCHGQSKKQKPWEESVRIPFLVRWPGGGVEPGSRIQPVLDSLDIMPTLLGICGVEIPDTVQGIDVSPLLRGEDVPEADGALLACHFPFHQWHASKGGREYRGVRTERHTYCRDLNGPWLLYDNQADPYQRTNLAGTAEASAVQDELEDLLQRKLARIGDEFLPGLEYVRRRGVKLNERGDVPTYADHGPTE